MSIRSVALQAYERAAREVGVDPYDQMGKAGLACEPPLSGDAFVPHSVFAQLLESTAEAAGCPDFGLRMGQWPDEFFEGPLVLLMRHADTLHQAIELIHRYGYAYSTSVQPALVAVPDSPGRVDLVLHVDAGEAKDAVQATEYTVCTVLRVLRFVCGRAHDGWAVMLPHRMTSSQERYRRFLDSECRFEMPFAAIRMAQSDLGAPLPGRSALRVKMAISYIEAHFARATSSVAEQVRRLLRQRLGVQPVMQSDIAAELSMHEKTLQRRLAREGRTFPALLDDVRRECFLALLRDPVRPNLAQMALMLGYSEQAALSRSCQRWFGSSPSDVLRRQHPVAIAGATLRDPAPRAVPAGRAGVAADRP